MKALLLAAGLGTRLRPLTLTTPKCLVPIAGKPLLGYWMDLLCGQHGMQTLVNTHYLAEQVRSFLQNSPYQDKVHLVHEPNLLGTAGTLLANRHFFDKGSVMLVHADNFSIFDPQQFIAAHENRPKECEITMMTFFTDHPENCGIVEVDKNNIVQDFHEKVSDPPGNLANGAVYILEPGVLESISDFEPCPTDFSTEVLPRYIGRINTFHNSFYHRDIGTPESYKQAEQDVQSFSNFSL